MVQDRDILSRLRAFQALPARAVRVLADPVLAERTVASQALIECVRLALAAGPIAGVVRFTLAVQMTGMGCIRWIPSVLTGFIIVARAQLFLVHVASLRLAFFSPAFAHADRVSGGLIEPARHSDAYRAPNVSALKVRALKVRALKVRATKVRVPKIRAPNVSALE